MDSRLSSFTSCNIFPSKLARGTIAMDDRGRIRPRHLQLCPTNKCNLGCSFCSCADRSRGAELPIEEVRAILREFALLGTEAVTITGGGEPLMYDWLNIAMREALDLGMKVSVTTNGLLLDRLDTSLPTWVRVSFSDHRELDHAFVDAVTSAAHRSFGVDWSFSYVLKDTQDWSLCRAVVALSGTLGFKYVRLVNDLLDIDRSPSMEDARRELSGVPGEGLVLYQGRKSYVRGAEKCWSSLLKPMIAADGSVAPCCGAQYAINGSGRDFIPEMSMGSWRDYRNAIIDQKPFCGSLCDRCYYSDYNTFLSAANMDLVHREFV